MVVQIDESLMRHKPKVCTKMAYGNKMANAHYWALMKLYLSLSQHHRGRATSNEVWVFGMVVTSSRPALGYMEIVPCRDANTLLPIIQAHTLPGTIIHSDQWSAYSRLQSLPNVATHSTANHSIEFVNPTTGVHTQHVESYWNRVKTKFKLMRGCHLVQLPSYLDEFMWRERYGTTASSALEAIIADIAAQYPV